jgi:hypothetical protein
MRRSLAPARDRSKVGTLTGVEGLLPVALRARQEGKFGVLERGQARERGQALTWWISFQAPWAG